MREIKFRWRDFDWNWVYWSLVKYSDSISYIASDIIDKPMELVSTETVWQYTWLLDNNWKEIFEGDIVEWKQAEWWILESSIDTNVYICKIDWFMNWWACRLNDGHCWFTLWSSHMTVVGNIYENENPDLITN